MMNTGGLTRRQKRVSEKRRKKSLVEKGSEAKAAASGMSYGRYTESS